MNVCIQIRKKNTWHVFFSWREANYNIMSHDKLTGDKDWHVQNLAVSQAKKPTQNSVSVIYQKPERKEQEIRFSGI